MNGMTTATSLRLSYRRGKILAGYVTLCHETGKRAARSKKTPDGLVIDYDEDGNALGIEVPTPCPTTVAALLRRMNELGVPDAETELLPLQKQLAPV